MRKRSRFYLGVVAVLALVAGALGSLYASIVFTPSRYPAFEKSQAEVIRKVHETVKPAASRPVKPAAKATQPGKPLPAAPSPVMIQNELNPEGYPVGFFKAMEKLGENLKVEADGTSHSADLERFQNMMWQRSGILNRWGTWVTDSAADEAAIRSAAFESLTECHQRYQRYPETASTQDKMDRPIPIAAALRQRLDGVETFLDHVPYDHFPDFDNFYGGIGFEFSRYAKLAVIRALEANDPTRAERLLTSYLKLFQRVHWSSYPDGASGPFAYDTLYFLAGYDCFSSDALGRIQKILDETHLSKKQIEEFRKTHAIRAGRRYRHYRETGLFSAVGNTWHWLYNGRPEKAVVQAMGPVMDRQMEGLVEAWIRDNPNEIRAREARLEATRRLLNFKSSPLEVYYSFYTLDPPAYAARYRSYTPSDDGRARIHGAFFNHQADLNRGILASIRYRRERGAWPASIQELMPRYLDSEQAQTAAPAFLVFRYPTASGAEIPLFYAINRNDRHCSLDLWYPPQRLVSDDLRALLK